MPYPNYLDLQAYLSELGLGCNDLSAGTLKRLVRLAALDFERDTGWHPFLATSDVAVEQDPVDGPEGSILFPSVGIISLEGVAIDGTDLTLDTNCWLQFRHKPNSGPYQGLEFSGYVTGARRSIVLNGVFGYTLTLPDEVKDAILSRAVLKRFATITGQEGDIKREKQGPVEFEYQQPSASDQKQYSGKRGELQQTYDEVVAYYRRVSL